MGHQIHTNHSHAKYNEFPSVVVQSWELSAAFPHTHYLIAGNAIIVLFWRANTSLLPLGVFLPYNWECTGTVHGCAFLDPELTPRTLVPSAFPL